MKNLVKYLNIVTLLIALSAVFTACTDKNDNEDGNLGLHIKVFSPTTVVPGTSMTINGGGFNDVTEIVFPEDIVVKAPNFEIITNEMIRVKAPAGLTKGGTISVRNKAGETAVSRIHLSVGKTNITGCSAKEGELIKGNEYITFYGKDMQFVKGAMFIDENGEELYVPANEFYRVAPGRIVIQVPASVVTGESTITISLPDGTTYESSVFNFETAKATGGHWEYTKRYLWKNEDPAGNGAVSWNGKYRFSNVETATGEEIHAFTLDEWDLIKNGTVYFQYDGADNANVRITTGWWSVDYGGKEYNCAEIAEADADGLMSIELQINSNAEFCEAIDPQHLLFTGSDYTPMGIYYLEAEWVDGGGGHTEKVRTSFWKNGDQSTIPAPSWSGEGRFARESNKTGEETYAFTDEQWEILKSEPFRIAIEKTGDNDPNVRITTGWWSQDYGGKEYNCFEIAEPNEDGTYFIELSLANYPELLDLVDAQHLLFTGSDYKLIEIYQEKEEWVEDDDAAPTPVVLWENPGLGGISWNGTYRFANVETVSGEECHAFSLEDWAIIKDGTFYLEYEGDEGSNVRITTGWWTGAYGGTDHNCIDMAEDGPNGHKIIKINIKEDGNLYDNIDAQHFLLTGDAYVPVKLYYYK